MDFRFGLILGAIIGYWMYIDAKKRKLDNPITWFWVGLLFSVLGLLTYWYWHIMPKAQIAPEKKKSSIPKKSAKKKNKA
jgi:hypothetical protein